LNVRVPDYAGSLKGAKECARRLTLRHHVEMRFIAFVLLAACASGPARVRDPQGRPLPTTARLDADGSAMNVRCPDGQHYLIVEPPPPYLAGSHVGTARVDVTDAPRLCRAIAQN
jgi:hypothetical protein